MRTLVSDMLPWIAENVTDSGLCIETESGKQRAIQNLDMACEILHTRIDDEGTLWQWDVPSYGGLIGLPEDCLEARQVWVNGVTTTLRDEWYLGKVSYGQCDRGECCYGPEMRDVGEFAIPIPLPKIRGIRLGWMAENDSDAGEEITWELVNEYGERKRQTGDLKSLQELLLSDDVAYDVTFFQKPETFGPVNLFLRYDNEQRFFWARYGPKTRVGAYRRKQLPRAYCGCNMVRIKGKRRYYRLTSEDDIMPFDSRSAVSWAVSAVAALRQKDTGAYNEFLRFALNELHKQNQDGDSAANVAPMKFRSGWACNPSQAANRPLVGTFPWGWRR